MFSSQEAELSVNAPCRALDAVQADKVDSRFLVGSCSVRDDNQLTVIRFHSEMNELGIDATLEHPTGAVGTICSSPSDKSLLLTTAETSHQATLWRIPSHIVNNTDELDYDAKRDDLLENSLGFVGDSLEQIATLDHEPHVEVVDVKWHDLGFQADHDSMTSGQLVSLDNTGRLTLWDVSNDAASAVRSEVVATMNGQLTKPRLAWDPHHMHEVCVTVGTTVQVLDWRTDTSVPSGTVSSIKAHRYGVTDMDYNRNKPFVLATGGQDGIIKYWDLRSAKSPLLVTRGGHSHYVSNVKYNPFHDQLVVSTGTDSMVNLWRISTISSSPLLTLDEDSPEQSETSAPNVRVAKYEHADSVYGMAWGAADAWVYVTVAYDGKVVLNHVPSKEKYKILL